MEITKIAIYKFSIPMVPFTIATGTMQYAQNLFIRIYTDAGFYGVGECSAFPMIVGETQATCFEMAKDFAGLWKGKDPLAIEERMKELQAIPFNSTVKSAFDMALYDIAATHAGEPLYRFLGGETRNMLTDLTIGIDAAPVMAQKALDFMQQGVKIIKVKLGKQPQEDVERIRMIRAAIGEDIVLRIDANQGWTFDEALYALQHLAPYNIQFCEQPMRRKDDVRLPQLKMASPIPIMADESVFDHADAERIIAAGGCSYVNIKLAKSGGILEALKINEVCESRGIPCMMGGMLESRVALSAFAHLASALPNIRFYDMDTCLLGHTIDPVQGGVRYNQFYVELPDTPGIGADVDDQFLETLTMAVI